jgi:hypothetical protein
MAIFWDVAPCSLVDTDPCFRDAKCLHHQGDRVTFQNSAVFVLFTKSERSVSNVTVEVSTIQLRNWEIPSLNPGPETDYLRISRGYLSSSQTSAGLVPQNSLLPSTSFCVYH